MRAFSLLEFVIAVAIAGIIGTAATTAGVGLYRNVQATEQKAIAEREGRLISEFVVGNVQMAGGAQVRPWQAVVIDDNADATACAAGTIAGHAVPACNGADRLHVVLLDQTKNELTLDGSNALVGSTLTFKDGAACATAATRTLYNDMTGTLISTSTLGHMKAVRCTGLSAVGTVPCTCTVSTAGFNNIAAASELNNGIFAVGRLQSTYLEQDVANNAGTLYMLSDEDGDGVVERSELADHIADTQLQYGLDTNGDLRVDTFVGRALTQIEMPTLRMIRVNIITSVPAPARDAPAAAQTMNGNPFSTTQGRYFHVSSRTVALRNLDLSF